MMSAFLVENRTIDKILNELDKEIRHADEWYIKELGEKMSFDFTDENWQMKLGQKMLDLNQLSLYYRYGDVEKDITYKFHYVRCTKVEAYKALRCWLYQCTEGNIPEDSRLYSFFKEVIASKWGVHISLTSPEYDQAEWG
jgi:hypothetical protein